MDPKTIILLSQCIASAFGCIRGFRYHPYDAVTINQANRKAEFGNTDDSSSVLNMWRDVVIVEEDQRSRLQNASECGRKGGIRQKKKIIYDDNDDIRIVGGTEARENEIPWQVAMLRKTDGWHGCGAALLSCDPLIVVTAAHCVDLAKAKDIRLGFGAHILAGGYPSPLDKHEVRMDVEEIIIHPGYSRYVVHVGNKRRFFLNKLNITLFENDLAILKVKNPELLECKKKIIWPACLPNKNYEYGGWERTLLSGWGRTKEAGDWSRTLKRARVPIVSDRECERNLFHYHNGIEDAPFLPFSIYDRQICAGKLTETKKGVCQGDSGGPLVAQDNANHGWSLVGIVSWGISSAVPGGGCGNDRYGVFTEVGKYMDWITSHFNLQPPDEL